MEFIGQFGEDVKFEDCVSQNEVYIGSLISKFWRHINIALSKKNQYTFVEHNTVVFLTCVSNISKIYWSLHKIWAIKVTRVWNHFPTFVKCRSRVWFYYMVQEMSLSDPFLALTARNWQTNEKEYSWHVPVMKFIGMKQLV